MGDLISIFCSLVEWGRPSWVALENHEKSYEVECTEYGVSEWYFGPFGGDFGASTTYIGCDGVRERERWF